MAAQGSLVGSRDDTTLMGLPLMEKVSSFTTCQVAWSGGAGGRGGGRVQGAGR